MGAGGAAEVVGWGAEVDGKTDGGMATGAVDSKAVTGTVKYPESQGRDVDETAAPLLPWDKADCEAWLQDRAAVIVRLPD